MRFHYAEMYGIIDIFYRFLICVSMLFKSAVAEHNCTAWLYDGFNKINCSFLDWTEVPQCLPNTVKVLLLSYNKIHFLCDNSFTKYTILVELHLNGNELQLIQTKTFLPLVHLKLLDISNVHFNNSFTHIWPPNINHLIMNDNRVERNLTFNYLRNLEILQAKNCSLFEFPQINENTPIFRLDLNLNPLNTGIFEGLLPLRYLKQLDVQWTSASVMNTTKEWCSCKQAEKLLRKRNVEIPNLNCTESGAVPCDSRHFGILDEIFGELIEKTEPQKCKSLIMVLIPLIVVTCISFCVLIHVILNAIKSYFNKEKDHIDFEEESPM